MVLAPAGTVGLIFRPGGRGGRPAAGQPTLSVSGLDAGEGGSLALRVKHRLPLLARLLPALLIFGLAELEATAADPAPAPVAIVQTGFKGFRPGTFGDAGANTYLSAKGNIETIHRWDLNRDGEIDLVFTQDHNHDYAPDAMIYWGGAEGPESLLPELPEYRSEYTLLKHAEQALKRVSWLPSLGGGRCVIADLNHDGFPDIISGNMMHNFRQDMPAYIYWGSAGGFRESNRTILPAYIASGIAVGDLNEDGQPEVVVANQGFERGFDVRFGPMINNQESYVYWGDATGYDASRRLSLPSLSAADVAIGDFNGDHHLDVAFLNDLHEEQSVYVYWGDGSGKFSPASRQVLPAGDPATQPKRRAIEMHTLLAADADGDGVTDLLVAGSDNALIFRGTKSGLNPERFAELPAQNCHALTAADLNHDGHIDLVVANAGTEDHPPASRIYWGGAEGFSPQRITELPTVGAMAVQAGDLNGDGFPELVFGNLNTSRGVPTQVFWGDATGYAADRRKDLQAFGAIGVGIADLDRDGHPDVVLMNHLSGTGETNLPTTIFWGNAAHHYSSGAMTALFPGGYMMYTVADLDDDGYPDLVLVTAGHPWIWWGSAAGYSAKNRTEVPIAKLPGGDYTLGLAVADLDRDGYLDLVCAGRLTPGIQTGSPMVNIVYGGEDHFKTARTESFSLPGGPATSGSIAITVADLNRDGQLDLIFPLLDTAQAQIRWGGPKGFSASRVTLLETNGASQGTVADLDHDGWLDVVFTSGIMGKRLPGQPVVGGTGVQGTTRNSSSYIYWGSPAGDFKVRNQLESYNALDVTVADLNRDGHLDLAFSNYLSDTTRELPAFIYWGDGTRGYSERRRTLLDAASSASMDALDLNRDGWLDLVVTNHQRNFSHVSGTNIYWGGAKGYSNDRRTLLPTIGAHLDAMADAGNIYTRAYEWDYVSAPIEAAAGAAFSLLRWKAEMLPGTGVKFQVRSAESSAGLTSAPWTGPDGPGSFYTTSGMRLAGDVSGHRWISYRAVLTSVDGANSARLSEVEIVCAQP